MGKDKYEVIDNTHWETPCICIYIEDKYKNIEVNIEKDIVEVAYSFVGKYESDSGRILMPRNELLELLMKMDDID